MVNSTLLTPTSRKIRRKKGKGRSPAGTNDSTSEFRWTSPTTLESKTESGPNNFSLRWKSWSWSSFHSFALVCLGAVLALAYFYYVTTMFETVTRFSHLSNLERELSLPTDVAFRYSFYKKIADAESFVEGLRSVIYDRHTDWPRSTNSFKKHGLATEAVLGAGFHLLKKFQEWTNLKLSNCWLSRHSESGTGGNGDESFQCTGLGDTLHFYLYAFWALESAMISLLFFFALSFSNSFVGGITSALLFTVAHPQRSNYEWIFPLQEKIGWAAALVQIFILSRCVLGRRYPSWTACVKIAVSSAVLFLSWKTEAQWILVSQLILISLLHFSNFISRYAAAIVIFGQITGWQYASLVSFDVSFLNWSFFLYVSMAAIITIFFVEPILDWVFGDKIEKWMFLRMTILIISFQMILITVRCDFGRVVGLKEDNRYPFSIGVMESKEVGDLEGEIKEPPIETRYIGYFPSASAEIYDHIEQFRKIEYSRYSQIKEATSDHDVSISSSVDNSVKVSARPAPFFQSYSKNAQSHSAKLIPYQFDSPDQKGNPSPKIETMNSEEAIKRKISYSQRVVSLPSFEDSSKGTLIDEEEISKEVETKKESIEYSKQQEGERTDGKSPLQRDTNIFSSQFPSFICDCFGSPLKFSLQAFFSKYLLLILAGFYILISGVLLPAFICWQNENIEREKMKKLRNGQKRNGEFPIGSSTYDFTIFYNCYYRFINSSESNSFAKTLGFTVKDSKETIVDYYWNPVILYITGQLGFFVVFCCFLDKRWELLFITQLCLLSSLLGDYKRVNTVFGKVSCGYGIGTNIHWCALFGILSIVFAASRVNFDKMYQDSRGIFETSNPKIADLVQAVKWIRMNSGSNSSFAGVESLMTVVNLSAQRPCVNHHHSAHLLGRETIEINGIAEKKMALPEFPLPAVSDVATGRVTIKQFERPKKKVSPDGVFVRAPPNDENSYSSIKDSNFVHGKSDLKDRIEVTTSTSHSRLPLLNADSEFEKQEKERLYKVYSMFSRRKTISEFHDGLLSLNVSYLFLSRELCSPPASSPSSMFFDNASSKTEKKSKTFFSYGIWAWEDPRVDKHYAHWQQIRKDCDFISFWDSMENFSREQKKQTDTKSTEILCYQLMNERNPKPFTRVFENGFYTILSTSL